MSFLLQLRTTAASHHNVLRKKLLRDAADEVQRAVQLLQIGPTSEVMKELNAAWAHGNRQLMLAEAETPPSGGGGRVRAMA